MDTIDRPDSNVPARYSSDLGGFPARLGGARELAVATPETTQVTPQVLLRGLSRHWWRIALVWLAVSVPLAGGIYTLVKPTYEAMSLLRVEPTTTDVYSVSNNSQTMLRDVKPYLQTQVELIKSNSVLEAALAAEGISKLPMIAGSEDPKADLRSELNIGIVEGNTYLIMVTLASPDPNEAAAIVNAVVDAYNQQHIRYHRNANRNLKTNLDQEREKLEARISLVQKELAGVVAKGGVGVTDQVHIKEEGREDGVTSFSTVADAQYSQAANELFKVDMDLIDKKTTLDTVQNQQARAEQVAAAGIDERPQLEQQRLEERIREEFTSDPQVLPLVDLIHDAEDTLESARHKARRNDDPAVQHAFHQLQKLQGEWKALWMQKEDEIRQRLLAMGEGGDQEPEALAVRAHELEATIDQLTKKRDEMKEMVRELKVERTTQNSDNLQAQMLNLDLLNLKKLHETIKLKLAQIDFEIGQEAYRVSVQDRAPVPTAPSNNKRLKFMGAAMGAVLFLTLGVFLLLEIKAERVADPVTLSTRVQSEVYALPPLPTARSLRKRTEPGADDQIEQFIQRLDHLRFGVCGNPAELEKGRCVLITSAIGGEGKTTLAAQLAARCGNAGMSTLLIDADLRRTGLCALLDIPEGPGLSDALLHDEPAATELVVPVQGGTFHLLPAGTPVPDTGRVLENRKLGLLIAQFRQLYDLVIIDSPPVLPVPDALILGRWIDGAVLAARYDISRFPQVERARRQLDGAGIAVLGTVINGMKNADSYYGRYSYSRRRSPQAGPAAAF